jgi:hypothetical protein
MRRRALTQEEILCEIRAIPNEYLPDLLQVVRLYRESVVLKPAEESFREGWRDALRGETIPISELWEGIDTEEA